MLRFGVFNLVAGVLQLTVPSYGLRLVRRFGAQRVGWFLVIAFVSLALVHLAQPVVTLGSGAGWTSNQNVAYMLASALLLIGMGHLETLFSDRSVARRDGEKLAKQWKAKFDALSKAQADMQAETARDIARREEVVQALRESEEVYRSLFAENPLAMCIVDLRSLKFLSVNNAALSQYQFAREEFMELKLQDLVAPDMIPAFLRDVIKPCAGAPLGRTWPLRRKDQTPLQVELTAIDLRYGNCPARLIVAKDVTWMRQRELESRETTRMETIGRVAAGAGHHFNNILTIIDGHANLLLREPNNDQTAEQLRHISAAANRAAALTRQLLAAGGRQMLNQSQLDMNELLRNALPMLRRLVGERITLQESLFSNLPPIHADLQALKHVLINLVLNARDAIHGSGTINITTSKVRIEQGRAEHRTKAGEFVRLAIHDTGCGMTPEVQAHVFEPFFTTRDVGNGTGLGLASVYGLVRQHSGWIEFSTTPGSGTEFRMFFPPIPPTSAEKEAPVPGRSKGTVLLVEPHDRSRDLARYILSRRGYHVIEADCAATALVLWDSGASVADLLLTDLTLPGGTCGSTLADRLRSEKPGLKVLYTSNASASSEGQDQAQAALQSFQFLAKPFTPDRLVQGVEAALESGPGRKRQTAAYPEASTI